MSAPPMPLEDAIGRYDGVVRKVIRGYRLGADADDARQQAWLRYAESAGGIRDAAATGGWLAAVARNECLRILRRQGREVLAGEDSGGRLPDIPDPGPGPDAIVADSDQAAGDASRARAAMGALMPRDRRLLELLAADPPASYADITAELGMPSGSIGPTRSRILAKLRREIAGDAPGPAPGALSPLRAVPVEAARRDRPAPVAARAAEARQWRPTGQRNVPRAKGPVPRCPECEAYRPDHLVTCTAGPAWTITRDTEATA